MELRRDPTLRSARSGWEGLGAAVLRVCGLRRAAPVAAAGGLGLGTGVALRGRVWPGGEHDVLPDGVVVVDGQGVVRAIGPAAQVELPSGLRLLGGRGSWVGPGVVDAHVHLAFGSAEQAVAGGVVGVRDLGAPPELAATVRTGPGGSPIVAVAGPLLTGPGGYPTATWGAGGFGIGLHTAEQARSVVRRLARDGVDLVKVALEPAGGRPVPTPEQLAAVVGAAHDAGLPVTAHALTAAMVDRAVTAGVDELAHTPVEPLPEPLLERLAATGVPVVSTLQTLSLDGTGAARCAAALHAAGVRLIYGTDLGNQGTRPGVDPRELDRLAAAGLGRRGALLAATVGAAAAAGLRGCTGRLLVGEPAAAVVLPADPLVAPEAWRAPAAVVCGGRLRLPTSPEPRGPEAGTEAPPGEPRAVRR